MAPRSGNDPVKTISGCAILYAQLGAVSGCSLLASTLGFGNFTMFFNWRLIHNSTGKLCKSHGSSVPGRDKQ